MKKYRNGGPTGKRIPGALYPGDRGYVPPPGNVGYRDWYYPHANDRFYTTDEEYIDLRFQPGPGENPNRPVVKMPPGSPAARSTTQVPVEIVKGLRVQGYEPGQVGHVRYDQERRFENGGLMNTDKLKQMYASGGLLKAILKDPKMRQMASEMLSSEGGTKKYSVGGKMYANGGDVDPEPEGSFDPKYLKSRQNDVMPSDEEIYAALQQTVGQSLAESGMSPQEYIAAGRLGSDWSKVAATARGLANMNFRAKEEALLNRLEGPNGGRLQIAAKGHPGGVRGFIEEQVAMSYPEGSVSYHQYGPTRESEFSAFDRAGVDYDRALIDRLNAMQPAETAITEEEIGKWFNKNAPSFPRDPKPVGFMGSGPLINLGPRR